MSEESQWTTIYVQAGSEGQRRQWLDALAAPGPSDAETLIHDFLPSIFGYSDPTVLGIAIEYLYHPDAAVAGSTAAY